MKEQTKKKRYNSIFDVKCGDIVWVVSSGLYDFSRGTIHLYPNIKCVKVQGLSKSDTGIDIFVNKFFKYGTNDDLLEKFSASKVTEKIDWMIVKGVPYDPYYYDYYYDDVYVGEDEGFYVNLYCLASKKLAIKQFKRCQEDLESEFKARIKYLRSSIKDQKNHRAYAFKNYLEVLESLKQNDDQPIESINKTT